MKILKLITINNHYKLIINYNKFLIQKKNKIISIHIGPKIIKQVKILMLLFHNKFNKKLLLIDDRIRVTNINRFNQELIRVQDIIMKIRYYYHRFPSKVAINPIIKFLLHRKDKYKIKKKKEVNKEDQKCQ